MTVLYIHTEGCSTSINGSHHDFNYCTYTSVDFLTNSSCCVFVYMVIWVCKQLLLV